MNYSHHLDEFEVIIKVKLKKKKFSLVVFRQMYHNVTQSTSYSLHCSQSEVHRGRFNLRYKKNRDTKIYNN